MADIDPRFFPECDDFTVVAHGIVEITVGCQGIVPGEIGLSVSRAWDTLLTEMVRVSRGLARIFRPGARVDQDKRFRS